MRRKPMWVLKKDGTVVRTRDYRGYAPAPRVEGRFRGRPPRGVRPAHGLAGSWAKVRAAWRRLVRPRVGD